MSAFNPAAYLQKFGWSEGGGLGKEQQGITEHIKATKKDDNKGIGCREDFSAQWASMYEQAAKGANVIIYDSSESDSESDTEPVVETEEEKARREKKERKERKKAKKAEKEAKKKSKKNSDSESDAEDEEALPSFSLGESASPPSSNSSSPTGTSTTFSFNSAASGSASASAVNPKTTFTQLRSSFLSSKFQSASHAPLTTLLGDDDKAASEPKKIEPTKIMTFGIGFSKSIVFKKGEEAKKDITKTVVNEAIIVPSRTSTTPSQPVFNSRPHLYFNRVGGKLQRLHEQDNNENVHEKMNEIYKKNRDHKNEAERLKQKQTLFCALPDKNTNHNTDDENDMNVDNTSKQVVEEEEKSDKKKKKDKKRASEDIESSPSPEQEAEEEEESKSERKKRRKLQKEALLLAEQQNAAKNEADADEQEAERKRRKKEKKEKKSKKKSTSDEE